MMTDNHVAGEGNAYYTLFREYDPDLGRWWRPDPIFQPWQSPYSAFDGNPIMFTDVWGLEAEKDPLKGFTPEDPLITPNVVVTADALEGTRKSAVDILGRRAYNLETNPFKKMDYIKHDGKWVSSLEYDNAMSKLINGLYQKGYDPILHGFDFDEEMSDNFWSMFNAKGARKYKLERLPHTGVLNPFFAGHGLEDNSQEMAGLFGLAGGLFKKAFGWLAGKGASKASKVLVDNCDILTASELKRLENAASRINTDIYLVGSRASGTAKLLSDWDYIINTNSRGWTKIKNSIPGAPSRINGLPRNNEWLGKSVDFSKPYIKISPRK